MKANKTVYYQIPIHKDEQEYTDFEAVNSCCRIYTKNIRSYQYGRLFSTKSGTFNEKEDLSDTFGFMDNITICIRRKKKRYKSKRKKTAPKKKIIMPNEDKCMYNTPKLQYLGYLIKKNNIYSDPEH